MEAKDGSEGFDFGGAYDAVVLHKKIAYTMDDKRKATVDFEDVFSSTSVTVTFDAETENPIKMQRGGGRPYSKISKNAPRCPHQKRGRGNNKKAALARPYCGSSTYMDRSFSRKKLR